MQSGIHESHRPGCGVQAAGSGRTTEDPGPRVEHPAAAHPQLLDYHSVRLFADRSRQDYLLREGTDLKYGARHLKRTIDRALVQPLSNLIASG
ncbi:MAG: hypothetical protein DMG57_32015 [Acidobacteria bacterium]|nr:MAG: hypothetical protein DMG57_32015 [Acidobacteriota bacterium]